MAQISLQDFRKSPATQIISLGPRCTTTYNLRRYYNFQSAFPFDWWITEEQAMHRLLADLDPGKIYDPALLALTENAVSVTNTHYDILLHHEFPRDWSKADGPVKPDFLDHIEEPKGRTAYLIDKFLGLDRRSERIMFVREQPDATNLLPHLERLFSDAEWCFVTFPLVQGEPGFDWKLNPATWDKVLAGLGVTLDTTRHRPFVFKGSEHHAEDFAA